MEARSAHADIQIPDVDIWDFLFERKTDFPAEKELYVEPHTSKRYSFNHVKDSAITFGQALRTRWNWQPRDVLAIFAANCIDYPIVTAGALYVNSIVAPINPAYTVEELRFQLGDCDAKAIVTQLPLLKAVLSAGIPRNRILIMGEERVDVDDVLHFRDFLPSATIIAARKSSSSRDVAYLVYSSGTTGLPKGVCLTHRNIVSNVLMISAGMSELSWNGGPEWHGDTVTGVLPIFHIYGSMFSIFHSLYNGLRVVILPRFTLDSFCAAIADYKITYGYIVPPILLALTKSPAVVNYDLSSIRMFMSAAAPLSRELITAVWDRLRIPTKQAYGLSETSPGTHIQSFSDWQSTAGSLGRPLPNIRAKFVSEDGTTLPVGSTGELWVSGPNIFLGYLHNNAATAAALTSDGYFRTGDIGYQDAQGNFYFTDRIKELIKYKGFQVAPAELEGILLGHPKIADVCVVGVYDERQATELPRACVVKRMGEGEGEEEGGEEALGREIVAWLAERVANFKKLRGGVVFVKEIPKTASGKILRRLLRDGMVENKLNAKL